MRAHARQFTSAVWLPVVMLLAMASPSTGATDAPRTDLASLQRVVDELAQRLTLAATVTASIVDSNPLLVSVEPLEDRPGLFALSFERRFLEGLDDDALRAVVAHELGHVWIFTHHPYLQTELLANRVAMRVVSRENLERVYAKVWERRGMTVDLAHFLGQ